MTIPYTQLAALNWRRTCLGFDEEQEYTLSGVRSGVASRRGREESARVERTSRRRLEPLACAALCDGDPGERGTPLGWRVRGARALRRERVASFFWKKVFL